MEEIDYAPLLPKEPPKGLADWLLKKGLLKKELLIYKMDCYTEPLTGMRERAVKLTCTACHRSVYVAKVENECHCGGPAFGFIHPETLETVGSGKHCLCPECGAEVEAKHIGNMGQWDCVEAYPVTVHKVKRPLGSQPKPSAAGLAGGGGARERSERQPIGGREQSALEVNCPGGAREATLGCCDDVLVLCGWCVRKWFEKDGRSGITTWPYEAYVVEKKRIIRLNAYSKFMSQVRLSGEWEQRKKFVDMWGGADLVYPWKRSLLEGTTAENSKLDLFWRAKNQGKKFSPRPVTYLRLWQKHPNIENLVMQGAGKLVAELIDDELENRHYMSPRPKGMPDLGVNWKEPRPAQMLGLNREEFQRCVADGWNAETWAYFREQKESGHILTREELALCGELGFHHCRTLTNGGQKPLFVARYLRRQKGKDKRCDISILNDYWRMAVQCGYDLNNADIRYPPNLYRVHERVLDENNRRREEEERQRREKWAKEEEKKRAKRVALMKARYKELSAFTWEKNGILIRPAQNEEELRREGELLHHCVGTYAESVAEGKSAIFFVRRAKQPDKPWYTLQLDEKRLEVRQNRGSRNCDRTPEVTAFEKEWLEWLRKGCKRNKDGTPRGARPIVKKKPIKKKEVTAA